MFSLIMLQGCGTTDKEEEIGEDPGDVVLDPKQAVFQEPLVIFSFEEPVPLYVQEGVAPKREFGNVEKRKLAFFKQLFPIVHDENNRIRKERALVLNAIEKMDQGEELGAVEVSGLKVLSGKYRVKERKVTTMDGLTELKRKVDIIPPELALIQAANESNWGRSYFAKKGNNLFGQWCFKKGCGIVPRRRSAGATHEVAAFASLTLSVRNYMRNLNSHPAYRELRVIREQMRENGEEPTGYAMAKGLNKYSGIGHDYVRILRKMIKTNRPLIEKADPTHGLISLKDNVTGA